MSLAAGSMLLHYRLAGKIGEGGMGEVWKAEDTSLGREVAIKVLPAAFAADPERLARFEREAKTLASLNHPGIAAVYGLHESGGVRFLAMEYVPGEDLAARLARGPLAIDDAVDAARRIAEALEAAHESGIVHRDLKPANVVLTADDRIKVLDFGLAKALSPEVTSGGDSARSPTVTSAGTAVGVILGTAAYMAPEQARGKPVDRRADVWAFGCVLYEMLTARRAFAGETVSDTLAAVLRAEPDLAALPRATPSAVRRLLARCFDKNPTRRLRDIGEARVALETLADGGEATEVAGEAGADRRLGGVLVALGGVALAAFAAGYLVPRIGETASAGIADDARIRRLTFDAGLQMEPTLSPDGNYVAYTADERGNLDILVRPLAGGIVNRVAATDADEAQPAWSPDGSRIAFVAGRGRQGRLRPVSGLGLLSQYVYGGGGDLYVVPAMGGAPVKLVERGASPSWSPDGGQIVFQAERDGRWDLWIVSLADGRERRLTDDESIEFQPAWSPDGRFVAYAALPERGGLVVVPAEGGDPVFTLGSGAFVMTPSWSPDGRYLYFASDRAGGPATMNLWRVPFAPGAAVRPLERVTLGEGSDIGPRLGGGDRLAYGTVQFMPDIWELDVASGALRQITDSPSAEDFPSVSRGGRLAMVSDHGGDTVALWTANLDGGDLTRVTTGVETVEGPRWSPDGGTLLYVAEGEGSSAVVTRRPGDLSVTELVHGGAGGRFVAPEWSPDGGRIAYTRADGDTTEIWVRPLDGEPRRITEAGVRSEFATWSPDGERLAFHRQGSGLRQVWTVPADGGEAVRLTHDDDVEFSHPQWSPVDPDEILVVVDHEDLGIVSARTGDLRRITGFATSTVLIDYPSWSPDGGKIYFSLARKRGAVYLLEDF